MGHQITQLGHCFPNNCYMPGWPPTPCQRQPASHNPLSSSANWILSWGWGGSTLPRDVTFTSITSGPICSVPPHPLHQAANPHKAQHRARRHDKQAPHRLQLHQACLEGPRWDSERLSLSLSAPLIGFPTRRGQQKRWGEENQREGASSR